MASTSDRTNNFDFLRCLAAFLVIYGHSLVLVGLPNRGLWGEPISTIGVLIFFSVSGYLVTESWQQDPRILAYFAKRSLRIFPALGICVSVCALIIGALATTLPPRQYYSDPEVLDYFHNCFLLVSYSLPGVFHNNTYKDAVNGSLWTLPVEFLCYILVAVLACGRRRLSKSAVILSTFMIFILFLFFKYWYHGIAIIILDTSIQQAILVMPYFFVGSTIRILGSKSIIRIDVSVIIILLLFWIQTLQFDFLFLLIKMVAIPYVALAFGLGSTPLLSRWGRYGDFSYGMYLYAFPLQQFIVFLSENKIGFETLILIATMLSLGFAYLSWHLIERPALFLKPKKTRDLTPDNDKTENQASSKKPPHGRHTLFTPK